MSEFEGNPPGVTGEGGVGSVFGSGNSYLRPRVYRSTEENPPTVPLPNPPSDPEGL